MSVEHLTIQQKATKAVISAITTAIEGQFYFTTDTDEYYFGKSDGTVAGPIPGQGGTVFITAISDTNTIDLTETAGVLKADVIIDPAGTLSQSGAGLKASDITIHAGSQNRLEIVSRELKLKSLGVIDVDVNVVAASLAAFVASDYSAGTEYQEGDVIILTTPNPTESWIHNGGSAGTIADFTMLSYDVSDAYVRALISATNALTYNSATGVMKWGGLMSEVTTISQNSLLIHYKEAGAGSTTWLSFNPGVSMDFHKGDVEFKLSTTGVILKSPDASRWRITILNSGALQSTKL